MLCNVLSFGQNNILLVNGKSTIASSVSIERNSVTLVSNNETQSISKADVLCIIPAGKNSYTYNNKTGKKMKISKKDIQNNYKGIDRARLFAYKYYKSTYNIGQLYSINSDSSISKVEFEAAFNEQQKKIKRRGGVAIGLGIGSLIFGLVVFLNTLSKI